MMNHPKLTPERLARRAIVYIRQSKPMQVIQNQESQRLQYRLVERARELGFAQVTAIDEDLGRTACGLVERPGFEHLVGEVCSGEVGAVFCIEASRLARNGREWHHLIELCGMVGAVVVDVDGVYDPNLVNDRLLLGLKGQMSEFETRQNRNGVLPLASACRFNVTSSATTKVRHSRVFRLCRSLRHELFPPQLDVRSRVRQLHTRGAADLCRRARRTASPT